MLGRRWIGPILVGLAALLPCAASPRTEAPAPPAAAALLGTGGADLQGRIYAARDRVLPALVNVQPVVRDFSSGQKEKQRVTGSGVLIRAEGYVVTNYHVAGQSEFVMCTLWNKERLRARLVGGDALTDLAVLQLDFTDYHGERPRPAVFGDSRRLETGQLVMALGSPYALSRSLSFGVVSTTDRYLPADFRLPSGERTGFFNTWIQTDAAINPGNSGGPLVDLAGEVVGINSRAFVLANNLGFSIPSQVVKEVVEQIIRHGRVERSWIGVEVQPLQELEDVFASLDAGQGVLVSDVEAESPAASAGIRAGDLLLRVEGEPVSARFYEEIPAFYKRIADLPAGRSIRVDLRREGENLQVDIVTQEYGGPSGVDFEARDWGFAVRSITKQMALDQHLENLEGVLVSGVRAGGPAEEAGLVPNDVVRFVDDRRVDDLDGFRAVYEQRTAAAKARVMLQVRRRDAGRFVLLKLNSGSREGS
jgi:serine protease Do